MTKTTHILPVVTLVLACIVATAVFTPPAYAHHIIASALIIPQTILALPESTVNIDDARIDLVTIPPGSFMMGSDSGDGDERPIHKVTINYSFDLGKTEVTVAQFKAFTKATGYKTDAERHGWAWHCPNVELMGPDKLLHWQNLGFEQTDDHPIACISFNDAKAFCKWLTEQTGDNYRLPTEAEWEYSCRAGTTADLPANINEAAWLEKIGLTGTSSVATRKPNPWGLYDMHGNVSEWCEDIYHFNYEHVPTDGDGDRRPDVPAKIASRRVLRGGSWADSLHMSRYSSRHPRHREFRDCGTGFRIVRAKPLEEAIWPQHKLGVPKPDAPETEKLTVDDIEFDFIRVNPGAYSMGSLDSPEGLCAHDVTIGYHYYLAKTEVTLEQFAQFVEQNDYVTDAEKQGWAFKRTRDSDWFGDILVSWRTPGFVQTDLEPATCVSYWDALAFCEWLSEKTGREIRLPTEAEWEYACRAGTTGNYAGNVDEMAWYRTNSDIRTCPVAQKKPNAWGFYDMHGNVWEWVQDPWHTGCEDAPTDGSAWLEAGSLTLTMRGGSFANPPWWLQSHIHMRNDPPCRFSYNHGFRLAMTAP